MFRMVLNYSVYRDEYSKKICKSHGANSGVRFTFKCTLENNPLSTVTWLFVLTIVIFAFIIRIFELPFKVHKDGNYFQISLFE